jgi:hypothetical protein
MTRPPEPIEGGWYGVPLPNGSFAPCVVTFFDGSVFAGFYFGPPSEDLEGLRTRESGKWVSTTRSASPGLAWEFAKCQLSTRAP